MEIRVQAWDDYKGTKDRPRTPGWARPVLANEWEKMHPFVRRRVKRMWRTAARKAVDEQHPQLWVPACRFDFLPVYEGSGGDTGATSPVQKMIIDGLVDAHVVEDDNRWHNRGELSLPPVKASWTGLVVRVVPQDLPEGHPRRCECRVKMEASQEANRRRAATAKRNRTAQRLPAPPGGKVDQP